MALLIIVGRWHCEVKSEEFMWLARQIIVGRWPPCPVLQQSKWVISGRMGHGGHHPTLICIPNNEANHSRTGSPCPVLQQEARVFTPLSYGEGLGVGLLYIYAILRAFSETHQITVWKHGFQVVKTRVSGRETKGFRVWNQGFCKWGVSLLKSVRKRNVIGSDCYIINKYFVKRCKIPFLHIYTAFAYLCSLKV